MIFVASAAFGQTNIPKVFTCVPFRDFGKPVYNSLSIKDSLYNAKPGMFLSPSFYTSCLGFFCKQEIKFDKAIKIPFRFRLGSVDDCDRLEGKRK